MSVEALVKEMDREAETTRRLLERIPEDKFAWKPHEKSMSLGVLAAHIATTQGNVARMLACDTFEIQTDFKPDTAESRAELLKAFESGIAEARSILGGFDEASLEGMWTVKRNGQTMVTMPRGTAIRFIMFNHLYHHRGQLSVYLRLLDVPLPSIYGPSADENPFA